MTGSLLVMALTRHWNFEFLFRKRLLPRFTISLLLRCFRYHITINCCFYFGLLHFPLLHFNKIPRINYFIMFSSKIVLFLCLFFQAVALAFRPVDNAQKNVALPTITMPRDTTSAPVSLPPVTFEDSSTTDEPYRASSRKKWGQDKEHDSDYWYNPTIHTLGNVGLGGALHAALAPLSTKLIDVVAYEGQDVRQKVAVELSKSIKSSKARVVDLCCGVGISTRALRSAFPDAETVMGIDTSSEMISMARFLSKHLAMVKPVLQQFSSKVGSLAADASSLECLSRTTKFAKANAEKTDLPSRSFDLVTVMYAFHEAPKQGRHKILKEAHRLLQPGGTLAVIDICTDYTPSKSMLAGEPYVLEYQKNIHNQLRSFKGFARVTYKTIVPNHVGMWVMKRVTI